MRSHIEAVSLPVLPSASLMREPVRGSDFWYLRGPRDLAYSKIRFCALICCFSEDLRSYLILTGEAAEYLSPVGACSFEVDDLCCRLVRVVVGDVLVDALVGACCVVVRGVLGQNSPQVAFIEDQ